MFSQCPHCQPYKKYTHLDDWLRNCISGTRKIFFNPKPKQIQKRQELTERFWITLLQFLKRIRVVEFKRKPDRSQLYNRGLLFFDEAKKRGVDIRAVTMFGQYVHEYVYRQDEKLKVFHKIPSPQPKAAGCVDNKIWTKRKLKKASLPVSTGESFWSRKSGLQFGDRLGYPLVVKPVHGSLSKHVTVNIQTKEGLERAIKIAKQLDPTFIVERHLPGSLYRATVIDQDRVFVCKKSRPHVVGDGTHSIRELIGKKNNHRKRGETKTKNTTLHIIDEDKAKQYLTTSQHDLQSVPQENQRILLSDTFTLAAGCDIDELTKHTHKENKEMFCQAAQVLDAGLVGFDFICPDISTSWKTQPCGIIEANTKPYADMHANPSSGNSQPVASAMWDAILAESADANM